MKVAAILSSHDALSELTRFRELGLMDCTVMCAWWSGAGASGYGSCAISHLGYEASLKRHKREAS
jgi:hypothetical protein